MYIAASKKSKGHTMSEIPPGIRHVPGSGISYLSISPGRHLHYCPLTLHSFFSLGMQRKGKQLHWCYRSTAKALAQMQDMDFISPIQALGIATSK